MMWKCNMCKKIVEGGERCVCGNPKLPNQRMICTICGKQYWKRKRKNIKTCSPKCQRRLYAWKITLRNRLKRQKLTVAYCNKIKYTQQREEWIRRQMTESQQKNVYVEKSKLVKTLNGKSKWLELTNDGIKKLEEKLNEVKK